MNTFLKTGKLGGPSKSTSTQNNEKKDAVTARNALTPWVEKYRPRTMDEVAYQDEIVSVLKKSLQGADLPNLLFYGPPGTGKTSTILAAARELFGDLYRERVLELNASDERGIQVIREKVKTFAQRTVSATRPDGKSCPPFKIIILDEADSMTGAAQAALRRTMERETRSTRFCLIGNYVSRIIEPITSRCSKFRFKPLARDILVKRLEEICKKEGVKCDPDALDTLVETSDGDLRRAITFLQSASSLKTHTSVTIEDINEITGRVPLHWLDALLEVCQSGVYDQVESYLSRFLMEGFSASQLLYQLHDRVVFSGELSDHQKSAIAEKIAVCEHRLTEGADEYLQLMDLCCTMMKNRNP